MECGCFRVPGYPEEGPHGGCEGLHIASGHVPVTWARGQTVDLLKPAEAFADGPVSLVTSPRLLSCFMVHWAAGL